MSVFLFDYETSFAYRVQRRAKSQIRCRYYSCHIKQKKGGHRRASPAEMARIREYAEKYDAKLAEWQRKEQRKGLGEMRPSRRNNTGVRGIRYGKEIENKRGRHYEWPAFFVCCADSTGKSFTRVFLFSTHGYEEAWNRAVECLGKVKGLTVAEIAALRTRMPDPLSWLNLSLIGGKAWVRYARTNDPFAGEEAA